MSSIKLTADSGGGTFEIKAPSSSANTRVITLPDTGNLTLHGGRVVQVVQTVKKDVFTTAQQVLSGYTDVTGLSLSITPSSSSNKILVTTQIFNGALNNAVNFFRLLRDGTFIEQPSGTSSGGANYNAHAFSYYDANYQDSTAWSILDSPATTSEITYKIQMAVTSGTSAINAYVGDTSNYFGISMITAYEVST